MSRLTARLARLCSDTPDIQRHLDNVPLEDINLSPAPVNIWAEIVRESVNRCLLARVIHVMAEEFRIHTVELCKLASEHLQAHPSWCGKIEVQALAREVQSFINLLGTKSFLPFLTDQAKDELRQDAKILLNDLAEALGSGGTPHKDRLDEKIRGIQQDMLRGPSLKVLYRLLDQVNTLAAQNEEDTDLLGLKHELTTAIEREKIRRKDHFRGFTTRPIRSWLAILLSAAALILAAVWYFHARNTLHPEEPSWADIQSRVRPGYFSVSDLRKVGGFLCTKDYDSNVPISKLPWEAYTVVSTGSVCRQDVIVTEEGGNQTLTSEKVAVLYKLDNGHWDFLRRETLPKESEH